MATATLPFPTWENPAALSNRNRSAFANFFHQAARVLAVGVGISIPLSTSMAEILVGLFAVCWLLSGELLNLPATIRQNRIAAACLAMFGVLLLSATYGASSWHDTGKALAKYREFLYVPLLVTVFQDQKLRQWGLRAFMAGVTVMILLSYGEFLFKFDIGLLSSTDFVIFKDRIIHGLLLAFYVFVLSHQIAEGSRYRWLQWGMIALALGNGMFLIQGRTGHLVLSILVMLFMWQRFRFRGLAYGMVLLTIGWGAIYQVSPVIKKRVQMTMNQLQDQFGEEKKRNEDARLEFYEYSLRIIRQNPWFGTGTGGFLKAYRDIAAHNGVPATEDPHSEYLLLAVQLGACGPLALLALYGMQWLTAFRLPQTERWLAQGVVFTIASGCLVNSLLYGFTGGLFFGYFTGLVFGALPAASAVAAAKTQPEAPLKSQAA